MKEASTETAKRRSMTARQALVIFAGLVFALTATAQQASPRWYLLEEVLFRSYGAADGLPIGEIVATARDPSGLAWLATSEGLPSAPAGTAGPARKRAMRVGCGCRPSSSRANSPVSSIAGRSV